MCLMVFNTAKNVSFLVALSLVLAIASLSTVLSGFIPESVSNVLNIIVGLLIIFFGIKMLVKKDKKQK